MSKRILHTPYNEANNPKTLSKAERELGIYSRVEILRRDKYFNTADRNWSLGSSRILLEFMRWPLMIYALIKYDVIHYNYGSYIAPSLMPERGNNKLFKKIYNLFYALPLEGLDVKLAYFLGKIILVTYQGTDARDIGYSKKNYKWHFSKEDESTHIESDDSLRKRKIRIFDRYADRIYSVNPDLLNTLPDRATFIPYSSIFPERISPLYPVQDKEKLTIVHAPSNRVVKGTTYLLDAIDRLRDDGIEFEFILVEGYSNDEAMEIYQKADIVVDQLLAGWYGAFGLEAMAMGKPVMCYIRNSDLRHLPERQVEDLPVLNVNPDTIYTELKKYLTSRSSQLTTIGKKSREYAIEWHSPSKIANRILEDISLKI